MVNLTKTKTRCEALLREYETKIAKIKTKFAKDWTNAFEWNSKEMYMLQCQQGTITSFLTFINNEPERAIEWLNYNIKTNKESLISCNYLNTSTNELANLAAKYEAMAKSEMIGELELLIEMVKTDTEKIN